jgi:tRNA threonylcarbamoyladenosine biosynthesis protein TsaE
MTASSRTSRSAAETERLGESLAPILETGDLVALVGELGAGKTRFVTGLARGLACGARVRSPSFAITNEYHGRLLLLHLDLYRLTPADTETLGLEEYLERGVVVVEWGDRLPARHLAEALLLRFEGEDETRVVTATAGAGRGRALLEAWSRVADNARLEGAR